MLGGINVYIYHVVSPQETFYSIALLYCVPPCLLLRCNNLRRPCDCHCGMQLRIPNHICGNMNYMHTCNQQTDNIPSMSIKPLDSLEINELLKNIENEKKNNPSTRTHQAKAKHISIPRGEYEIDENTFFETYMVKPGDTIFSIARRFNTTPQNI